MPTRAAFRHRHRCVPWIVAALLATTLPAAAAPTRPSEPMAAFKVERADTLIWLSRDVLVTPDAWSEVARLNRLPDANRVVPGPVLLIPTRLMRAQPAPSKLFSSIGDVQVGDAPAVEGSALSEGQTVQTGPGGSAVVEPGTGDREPEPGRASRKCSFPVHGEFRFGARWLVLGRAALAERFGRGLRHQGAACQAVRSGHAHRRRRRARYCVPGRLQRRDERQHAGRSGRGPGALRRIGEARRGRCGGGLRFHTTNAAGGPPRFVKLLDAPDLSSLAERFERHIVRFALPGEATALRVQVAADAAFDKIVSDQRVEPGAEARIVGRADATCQLCSRRIDAQGIEGFDANRSFVLKARPEPPAYLCSHAPTQSRRWARLPSTGRRTSKRRGSGSGCPMTPPSRIRSRTATR